MLIKHYLLGYTKMNKHKSNPLVRYSVDHPKSVTWAMSLFTLLLVLLALLPSLWPATFNTLNPLQVDTDPENMLSADEPVRVFHNASKQTFSLWDMVVVGVVNPGDPEGVFNPASLQRIHELTEFAKTLTWPDPDHPEKQVGVIEVDILAPSVVDNIEQGGMGVVNFSWLMPKPPATQEEALAIRKKAQRIPLLNGTVVSEDGLAIALYLPLTDKHLSYRVREALLGKIAEWEGSGDEFHITGLPVAEDTFGVEMFYQMAISAPLAMLVIFLLLWWFFKKLSLISAPMILAMVCSLATMALLIISGNTIHIMSSMIPIFIMPIAVLDAIHILSDFFDEYQKRKDRRETILYVMQHLFTPMLFTTLTTMAGFASLLMTPIPPVQTFGLFISIGVLLAWFWTITFIPAFIMFIPEEKLANFGHQTDDAQDSGLMSRLLSSSGQSIYRHARWVLIGTGAAMAIGLYGISQININDNPIKWFDTDHPIRIADKVLNEHFGGTYLAYLELEPGESTDTVAEYSQAMQRRIKATAGRLAASSTPNSNTVFEELYNKTVLFTSTAQNKAALLNALDSYINSQLDRATDDMFEAWDEAQLFIDHERQRNETFKQPEVLQYISDLQTYLASLDVVGKSSSVADVVKTVYRELLMGKEEAFRIPDSSNAVAQTLITYQNSHRPNDLWHFVTPDYRKATILVQLTSGDNQDMAAVETQVKKYFQDHPPPFALSHRWFGLTYINVIWQERMVAGMAMALAGSFVVVLIMMVILFRSLLWGILAMIPLAVTVWVIYGIIGLIGKDYDMPVAVLSALSLGLSVDYAIHFLSRSRQLQRQYGSWQATIPHVFAEPARAITRNAIVVGVGFLPLLAAPLVPYQTVGIFIAAILLLAGIASLLILPAMITLFEPWLFRNKAGD